MCCTQIESATELSVVPQTSSRSSIGVRHSQWVIQRVVQVLFAFAATFLYIFGLYDLWNRLQKTDVQSFRSNRNPLWDLKALAEKYYDMPADHVLDTAERQEVGYLSLARVVFIYIIYLTLYFNVPFRVHGWLREAWRNIAASYPNDFKYLLFFDISCFCATALCNWQLALGSLCVLFVFPPCRNSIVVMNSPMEILKTFSWLLLLLSFLFMEFGMVLFVSMIHNPDRNDEVGLPDLQRKLLQNYFPGLIDLSRAIWKPEDSVMFLWPALLTLVLGATRRYPLRLFRNATKKSFLQHTSLVLQHLILTHTIIRPLLFSLTILPSQKVTCASDRFAYVSHVSDYYMRAAPWVMAEQQVFSGGCNDLFPSGHCIFTTTVVLLVARVRSGWLSIWMWGVLFFSIVQMVEKGNHYSIDAIGSVFITSTVWYLLHDEISFVNSWDKKSCAADHAQVIESCVDKKVKVTSVMPCRDDEIQLISTQTKSFQFKAIDE